MSYVNPYEREPRRKAEQTELQRLYAQEELQEEPEVWAGRRVLDTMHDVEKNVVSGAVGSVEGVVDFALGGIGALGGLFSPRFAEIMKKAIQYDVTNEAIMPLWRNDPISRAIRGGGDTGEYSYLKEDGTVNSIARGVGGMLPAVLVSVATMGAATPAAVGGTAASAGGTAASAASTAAGAAKAAKLAQTLSTVTMATGAAGQASQEAYQDGADFYGGQAYGAIRGATEAATEYMLGGTTKLFTGGGRALLPGVRKSVASVGLKRVAKAALEEGLEEGISEMADPLTRTTYKGKEALTEYADPAFYGQVLKAVKDGSLTGLAFQGTVGHMMGNTGKAADMREIQGELDTLKEKKLNLSKNNKLTNEAYAAIGEAERENYRVMEGVLKKATPEKRAALMEEYGLSDMFDGNGAMKADFAALLDRRATVGQTAAEGENGSPAGSAGVSLGFDRRTASVDAEAEKVAKVLSKEGREQFTDVDGLSKEGRKNLRDVKRVMEVFRDISDGAVGEFVIAKESVSDNAYFDPETGYTVIGADALENGINVARKGVQSWFQTALHEVAHGGEGTDSHVKLSAILRHIGGGKYYTEMLKQLGSRGYWNGKASDIRTEVEKIIRKVERGEALTDKQTALANVIASEGTSIMAELALGNEHFARELLDADASIVEKLLNRIAEVKEALARRKDAAAKEAFEELRVAEGAFLEALAEKGMRFEKGKIIGASEEEDEVKKSKKGANRPIDEQDLETYLKIGKTKHTRDKKEEMMKQGKKPILTSVSEIQDFLSNVIHGKAGGEVRAFGFVGERLANEVKKKRGSLDIQDHYLEIVADDLREAYIRHHQPKEKGDIALSEQDFLHIPQYLNDFDGIIDIVTHKNRTQIHVYKETEDGFIKILTVVSGERNALQVTKLTGSSKEKFFKKYKKTGRDTGSPGSSSFDEENSNFATRTRHTAGVLPNDSIHDSEPIVKPSDEISSENFSKPVQKSRKTISKPKDKLPTEAELKGRVRELTAALYRQFQDEIKKGRADALFYKMQIQADAREICNKFGISKADSQLSDEMEALLGRMLNGELSYEQAWDEAEQIAKRFADMVQPEKVHDEQMKTVVDTLHNTRIRLTDTQVREVMNSHGSYERFRKSLWGRLILAKQNSTPLDVLWQEWAEQFPDFFDPATPEGDMPARLEEIYREAEKRRVVELPVDVKKLTEDIQYEVFTKLGEVKHSEDQISRAGERVVLAKAMEGMVSSQDEYNTIKRYMQIADDLDRKQADLQALWEQGDVLVRERRNLHSMLHKGTAPDVRERVESELKSLDAEEAKLLEQIKKLREAIRKEDNKVLNLRGNSVLKRIIKSEIARQKGEFATASSYADLRSKIGHTGDGVREWKAGTFLNQSQPKNQGIFVRTMGVLAKAMRSGKLVNDEAVRRVMGELHDWYTKDAKNYLTYDEETKRGEYKPELADKMKTLAEGKGALRENDLQMVLDVMNGLKHSAETYRKVWKNGKMVDAIPEAEKYVSIEQENQELRQGKMNFIMSSWYMRCYADPHTLVRYMDCYREGFYSTMFERLRAGTIQSQVILKKMNDKINEALEDPEKKKKREERNSKKKHGLEPAARNTEYFKSLSKRKIHLHGADMPVGEAISLYMTCNREQAKAGLLENGYSFAGEGDGNDAYIRRVFGFTGNEKVRDDQGRIKPEYAQYIQGMQDEIYGQLSELDRKFIAVATELLNNDCKEYKRVTDLALNGWSNVAEEYYFPIRRYETFKSIDKEGFFGEVDHVTNASFNKNTKPGARNQLLIESIDVVLARHMRGVAKYAALGQVIRDYDTLRTLDVSGNPNAAVSIAAIEGQKGGWIDGTDYFAQLLKDVQGIREEKQDEVTKVVGKLRGNYAKFQLAANPKVIATQLSSLFAGMNIIDPDVMIYAFNPKVDGRDVYDYSELAEIRASENTAAMAQGLLDEAGDKLMAPIGWMDSWVVRRLWVASQHQIAKSGPKLGTEENKKAAAKLLDKVILETQQNALATEKSQAARSHSEIQKMLTMFTSDAVKGVGQLLDAVGEITVIRNEAKVRKTPVDTKRLAAAKRRAGRAAGSLAAVAVYGAILAAIIKRLLDRDEEWTWVDFLSEVGGGLLGGLPIIKEAYEMYWGSGYGMEDMSVAAVNDLMSSTKDTFEGLGALARGDLTGREALRGWRNLLYSLGQVTGVPIRNAYTWSRRLVGIVVPDAAYKMENAFTKQPYASDIAKAIEREDEGRLETVIGVMLDENVGEVTSSAVRQEMKRLVVSGMDVLPRGVGDTVTVDGEAVKLTARQKTAFKAVYSEANKSVERMVGLAYYANASDEAKAKAIKRVYGIYYNRAIEDLLGVELENKNTLLSRAINPEVLAVVMAVCGEITADVGKDGKVVAGSKRKKVEAFVESLKLKAAQKYMIMGALGYKNKKGKEKVLAYVNGLGLSKSEREAIMGYSGY